MIENNQDSSRESARESAQDSIHNCVNVKHKSSKTKIKVPSLCYFCIGSCVLFFVIVPISIFITTNDLNLSTSTPI
jgi:hypothetical protein